LPVNRAAPTLSPTIQVATTNFVNTTIEMRLKPLCPGPLIYQADTYQRSLEPGLNAPS
jgi:hypothetical protein